MSDHGQRVLLFPVAEDDFQLTDPRRCSQDRNLYGMNLAIAAGDGHVQPGQRRTRQVRGCDLRSR